MQPAITVHNKIPEDKLLKAAPFKKEIRVTQPHKHNSYLEVILLTQGSGTHTIDGVVHPVLPPVVHVVAQHQVHCWQLDTEPDGYVLLIKQDFVNHSHDAGMRQLLHHLAHFNAWSIPDCAQAETLFVMLCHASGTGHHFPNILLLEGLLKALLACLAQHLPAPSALPHTQDYYQGLRHWLYEKSILVNNVSWYATQLHTTPQNLNHVCRKHAGCTASQVIAEAILAEARRLLQYSSLHIAEVAAQLQFAEATHFIKFFKRHAGCTPRAWRQQLSVQ